VLQYDNRWIILNATQNRRKTYGSVEVAAVVEVEVAEAVLGAVAPVAVHQAEAVLRVEALAAAHPEVARAVGAALVEAAPVAVALAAPQADHHRVEAQVVVALDLQVPAEQRKPVVDHPVRTAVAATTRAAHALPIDQAASRPLASSRSSLSGVPWRSGLVFGGIRHTTTRTTTHTDSTTTAATETRASQWLARATRRSSAAATTAAIAHS